MLPMDHGPSRVRASFIYSQMIGAHLESTDLHGNVPDRSGAVLLLIDVINDLDFPQNEYLVKQAVPLAKRICALKTRCAHAGIPAVYVNDNRGKWRSDFHSVLEAVQEPQAPGREFAHLLAPTPEDYVVLKPKHSAFLATPLDLVLQSLGVHTVIISGITTNSCVVISAGELFVRGYRLVVPRDCVEALTPEAQEHSLKLMEESYHANTSSSEKLDIAGLLERKE
jgi:nicotinamidase-related amidase